MTTEKIDKVGSWNELIITMWLKVTEKLHHLSIFIDSESWYTLEEDNNI